MSHARQAGNKSFTCITRTFILSNSEDTHWREKSSGRRAWRGGRMSFLAFLAQLPSTLPCPPLVASLSNINYLMLFFLGSPLNAISKDAGWRNSSASGSTSYIALNARSNWPYKSSENLNAQRALDQMLEKYSIHVSEPSDFISSPLASSQSSLLLRPQVFSLTSQTSPAFPRSSP